MSNYGDYFNELASKSETKNEIDFGSFLNHKYNRTQRNYRYTHPNQLRTMTTHHSKKVSHSKQNDLLGAIEMLAYKAPEILPISAYTKQVDIKYGSGKKKPFNISETEKGSKPPVKPSDPKKPTQPVKPVKPVNPEKPLIPIKPKVNGNKDLLKQLVDKGLATVHYKNTKPTPPPKNVFTPRVKGELSPKEIYAMPISKRIDYAKNMATLFKDKGGYRLPPPPPPPEKMYKGKVEILGSANMPINAMKPAPAPPKKTPTVITATPNPKQICIGDCPS